MDLVLIWLGGGMFEVGAGGVGGLGKFRLRSYSGHIQSIFIMNMRQTTRFQDTLKLVSVRFRYGLGKHRKASIWNTHQNQIP